MTTMTSDTVAIEKSATVIYKFLCNFNNYEQLMPPQVVDWSSQEAEGVFTIKNMATIGLKIVEMTEPTTVRLERTKAPFDLSLICNIMPVDDNNCSLRLDLNADMNPVFKMMAEKPLTNFINVLAHNCKKVCEASVNP